MDLKPDILRDQRIMDTSVFKIVVSDDYSVKSLWGMPKTLQKAVQGLTKFNQNKMPTGQDLPLS